jgi:hypothetical protein
MFEHLRTYVARPTVFLAAGIAIGALLAPAFGGSGAQGVTTYTRAVSCQGLAWHPTKGNVFQDAVGTRLTSIDSGYYVCSPDLPHKAVVTRVRFTLFDSQADVNVSNCALVRAGLTPETADNAQLMAAVGTTADSSSVQRLTDTTIGFATVDNLNFAYYLQCFIIADGTGISSGIYGADITFKISAANG